MALDNSNNETTLEDKKITADYILNLYKEAKTIPDKKEKRRFVQDIKKLVPYLGQTVTLELEED
jgi:hypothetical protein